MSLFDDAISFGSNLFKKGDVDGAEEALREGGMDVSLVDSWMRTFRFKALSDGAADFDPTPDDSSDFD